MSTPTNPTNPANPPNQPNNQPPANLPTSYVDPSGAWAKFLSTPNAPASAKDVQTFMMGLMKFFNVLIQQQQSSMKEAMDRLKKTGEGDE